MTSSTKIVHEFFVELLYTSSRIKMVYKIGNGGKSKKLQSLVKLIHIDKPKQCR
jgi:hypothetical protein